MLLAPALKVAVELGIRHETQTKKLAGETQANVTLLDY
jgi:hypothetical protein